jgi:SHS2 domain-containing protein
MRRLRRFPPRKRHPVTVSYRFVDHTAELQLEIEAPTRAAVLAEAVLALADLLGAEGEPRGVIREREVAVRADDDPALLAAWLDELVFVAETEGLVPRRAEQLDVGLGEARGTVLFAEGPPPHLVKGVTYHDLELAPDGGGWRGRAVLDV